MNTWISTIKDVHEREPKLPSWSKKTLFTKARPSVEWHQQIAFTAGGLRPSSPKFQWSLVQKHTDHYLKKKGKLSNNEIDVRLASLIEQHEARDVAVAACAHAMSPKAIRSLLNAELDVAPTTFSGLEMYLQCLIAANHSNPTSVARLEAQWAKQLLPYAVHGDNAAGKYLEGVCYMLRTTDIPNMNGLPDFTILARRAFKTFALHLDGLRFGSRWVVAYNAVSWMATLSDQTPFTRPPGTLTAAHFMDAQFPIWRAWERWRPNLERIVLFGSVDAKRAVLCDMFALEGPDFINGTHQTLRDGIVGRYTPGKPLVRFRNLVIAVENGTREELGKMLEEAGVALERALKGGEESFKLFVRITLQRRMSREGLQLLEAIGMIQDTLDFNYHDAVFDVYAARDTIGGRHVLSLEHVVRVIDTDQGELLRKAILRPWFVEGIENCIDECCLAIRKHIDAGLAWTHLVSELHKFFSAVRSSPNCLPLLSNTKRRLINSLPASASVEALLDVFNLCEKHKDGNSKAEVDAIQSAITAWMISWILEPNRPVSLSDASKKTVDTILQVWNDTATHDNVNPERRSLAILVSKRAGFGSVVRIECLQQIVYLPEDFVLKFLGSLQNAGKDPERSCTEITKLLAETEIEVRKCWKRILYNLISSLEPDALLEFALDNFGANHFVNFMLDLNAIFSDIVAAPTDITPPIFRPDLHLWVEKLLNNLEAIKRLEKVLGAQSESVAVLLRGGKDSVEASDLTCILMFLKLVIERPVETIMQKAVGKLVRNQAKIPQVATFVKRLWHVTPEGLEACHRIWNAKHGSDNGSGKAKLPVSKRSGLTDWEPAVTGGEVIPDSVVEIIIAGWLQDEVMLLQDKAVLSSLADLLDLAAYRYEIPTTKLAEASEYFEQQEAAILQEARRLENLQKALKKKDPHGTKILLDQLGIEDTDPIEDELERLPISVAGAVERIGHNEIEISFPITSWTDLERRGMGVGEAKTLLVRLFLDPFGDMPTSYCVHLDTDDSMNGKEHTPWTCLSNSIAPEHVYCTGKPTPLTWQMSRVLYRYIESLGCNIAELHDHVQSSLALLTHSCMVCGAKQTMQVTQLRRSIPCDAKSCTRIWSRVPIEIRVPELRTDHFAIDILLTGVYAAAMTNRMDLLPGCPINNTVTVQAILNTLPSLASLPTDPDISGTLKRCHKDAEKLIIWAAIHFRGFFVSAKGMCKIPGLPVGTHQFLLANTTPLKESDFTARIPNSTRKTITLFHGTSIDRLPAILAQGLRIQSGTNLQRTGAAHGRGIYMAEDPTYSFTYSAPAVSWRHSGLNGMRLLLGCEVAGTGRIVVPGVHVITDEKSVMLRYVFLLPGNAVPPIAAHIVPAMGSALSALRSGAI